MVFPFIQTIRSPVFLADKTKQDNVLFDWLGKIKSESLQYQFNWNPFSISSIGLIKRAQLAVVPKRAKMSDSHWSIWTWFLDDLDLDDPFLTDFVYPVPLLQVFAQHLRTGELAPSGDPLRSRSVEDYIRSVGQEIASRHRFVFPPSPW
jgi:hypothetical protein